MNYCIDLILGKAFWIFIFFHFPDSRLFVLTDFHFYFCFLTWVKTENLLYPFVKNDLKLCVNHQFIAPLLYNQITQLIFITDIFRPKVQHFLAARFLCARSAVFCQNVWQITQRLPGNWRGGGKRFSGAFRAGTPSPLACLLLARPFFLEPTTSKRLLRRLMLLLQGTLCIYYHAINDPLTKEIWHGGCDQTFPT